LALQQRNRICILTLLVTAVLLSTGSSRAGIRLGVTGGLARYGLSGDEPEGAKFRSRNRGTFGAVLELDVYTGVRLSLQPSLIQKGTGIAYQVPGQKERVDSVQVKSGYLSLPVMLKVFTPGERWYVSSGLELAWLLSAEYETSAATIDIKDDIEKLDLAIHFGAGRIVPVGKNELFFEARYTQSIMNVVSGDDEELRLRGIRVKNSGLMFVIGFLFRL